MERTKILDHTKIDQKLRRLAYEIYEENYSVKKLYFLGINNNGYAFAQLLKEHYDEVSQKTAVLGRIQINPAKPLDSDINLEVDEGTLNSKHVIIVDDVANTGRTIFYALKPILSYLPKKVEVAVLVDRMHKTFPIKVDYVGLSLSTTLRENIKVDMKKANSRAAYLE